MTPELTVVIPTRRHAAVLANTLGALARQEVAADRIEVIVVADGEDTGGLEETKARSTALPFRLSFLSQPRGGAAKARNRGAREARAPIVLFLDDDMQAAPGLVGEHLVRHSDSSTDVVLGHFSQASEKLTEPFFAASVRAWWSGRFRGIAEPVHRFSYDDLFSGHFSVRRDLFFSVGGFEERFTHEHSGEDYELAVRLLAAGARFFYAPRATAVHVDDPTVARALKRAFADGRGNVIMARKHPDLLTRLPLNGALSGHERTASARTGSPSIPMFSLAVAERLKLRRLWRLLFGRARSEAYWSGVLTELGSLAALGRLLQEADLSRTEDADAIFDVRQGYAGLAEILAARAVHALDVWVGDTPVCRIAREQGVEPLRPVHVVDRLAREHAASVVEALGRSGWTLDEGLPPRATHEQPRAAAREPAEAGR